jgi:hypothetical protein
MNSLPQVIENIIIDYKVDLDVTDNTNKKYSKVLKELNNLINNTDIYMRNWYDNFNCDYLDVNQDSYGDYNETHSYSHYLLTTLYCFNNF